MQVGFAHLALGFSAYREGDAARAFHQLQPSQLMWVFYYDARDDLRVQLLLLRAMITHELGRPEEARQSLQEAEQLLNEYLPRLSDGTLGEYWHIWLFAEILHREAKESIGDGAGAKAAATDASSNTGLEETAN